MSYHTLELTDQEVLLHAQEGLKEHLPLPAEGYKCTTDDLFRVLLGVAANQGTIESVCADLAGTPDPQTIRGYLNEQLCVEELPKLEKKLNQALAAEVPRQGGRWLDTKRFQLTRFAKFIQRALEEWYGCARAITAPALPRG